MVGENEENINKMFLCVLNVKNIAVAQSCEVIPENYQNMKSCAKINHITL
jgi:hypothetical protein